jgi:hypothetical protein
MKRLGGNLSVDEYDFPPPDLMPELISRYFNGINRYIPLLHRPTFEAGIEQNLHKTNQGFANTVLLVCALGARYCEDPRVFLLGVEQEKQSSGWRWFRQVPGMRSLSCSHHNQRSEQTSSFQLEQMILKSV